MRDELGRYTPLTIWNESVPYLYSIAPNGEIVSEWEDDFNKNHVQLGRKFEHYIVLSKIDGRKYSKIKIFNLKTGKTRNMKFETDLMKKF